MAHAAPLAPPSSRSVPFTALFAATSLALAALLLLVFLVAPEAQAAAGGLAQKIFYFHVPSAYAMYLGGTVCFGGSVGYLLHPSPRRDAIAQAGAEVAVLFGLLVLTSGPLWAKKAWGVYWAWEPRLVTSMLSFLLYAAIVLVRSFAGNGEPERRFAAALGVLSWFNLPIIHYAVQQWGGVHPRVISSGGGGLAHPMMRVTLMVGFLTMTLLASLLVWSRSRQLLQSARVRQLEERAEELGLEAAS